MNAAPRILATFSAVFSLASCTSLNSYRDPGQIHQEQALSGVLYSLPMRQYAITVTATLAQCENAKKQDDVKLAFEPAIVTSHDIPGESYYLDYTALDGWTKTTSFGFETYENGTLRSINASAEDKSAEIVITVVKTGLGIAALASGIPFPTLAPEIIGNPAELPPAQSKSEDQGLSCKSEAKRLLIEVAGLKSQLKSQTDDLAKITKRTRTLTDRQPIYGLTAKEKEELSKLLTKQDQAAAQLTALQGDLSKAKDKISISHTEHWPTRAQQLEATFVFEPTAMGKLEKLLELRPAGEIQYNENNGCGITVSLYLCLLHKLSTSAKLVPLTTGNDSDTSGIPALLETNKAQKGVYIRPPAPGMLLVCRADARECNENNRDRQLYRSDVEQIAQLGTLQLLPFENKGLQQNTLSLSLRSNGSIEKLAYSNPKARGETGANLASDLLGQWANFVAGRDQARKEDTIDKKQSEMDALQYQIDLFTKKQQLDALERSAASDLDSLAGLEAEKAQTEARTALLEAQLAELRAKEALRDTAD